MTTVEDRSHRSHKLNPRRWPKGREYPDNSKSKLTSALSHVALLSTSEMHFIQDVPRLLGHGNYANLGHSRGGSAILMADAMREHKLEAKVYSVDLFPGGALLDAERQLNRFGVRQWVELIHDSTDAAYEKVRQTSVWPFRFVFVDADHTYEAVKRDTANWSKLTSHISWHDTNQEFSHQAVEEFLQANPNWEELKDLHIDRIRTARLVS